MSSNEDYDYEPKAGKSLFLRLKDKDQTVVVRLASKPYREPKVWKTGVQAPMKDESVTDLTEAQWFNIFKDPEYTVTEVFHWVVIDREDGAAKIFTSTAGVYKSVKDYAQKAQWGDPTQYDLEITRTEAPGRGYYTVSPYPDKGDITGEEYVLTQEINLAERLPNARFVKDKQIDDIHEYEEQQARKNANNGPVKKTAAFMSHDDEEEDEEEREPEVGRSGYEKAKDTRDKIHHDSDDVILEDIDDKPIDLSEIPF